VQKVFKPASGVIILGEGRDEWGRLFFKFAVHGSESNIPPFSADEIMENMDKTFSELLHAGARAFQKARRNELLRQLDERKREAPKFRVVTRLGWNSGAFVLPQKTIGEPNRKLEPSFRHLDQPLLAKYRVKGTFSCDSRVGSVPPAVIQTRRRQNTRLELCGAGPPTANFSGALHEQRSLVAFFDLVCGLRGYVAVRTAASTTPHSSLISFLRCSAEQLAQRAAQ
jgi:hypothetical protein